MNRRDQLYDAHEVARAQFQRAKRFGVRGDDLARLQQQDARIVEEIRQENLRLRAKRRGKG